VGIVPGGALGSPLPGKVLPGNGLGGGFGQLGGFVGMQRLPVNIEPNVPLSDLLPSPPPLALPTPPWLVTDLTQVPEVFFQKPLEGKTSAGKDLSEEARQKVRQQMALTFAKINYVNRNEPDAFVKALMKSRADLAGLPFLLGDSCRMDKNVSRQFAYEVAQVRPALGDFGGGGFQGNPLTPPHPKPTEREIVRTKVAAWVQMLATAPAKRKELLEKLAVIPDPDATRALAKLAVFAPEEELRDDAVAALKHRNSQDYTPTLIQGLRYPYSEFAEHATQAMVRLQRQDLVGTLVDFLDEPDPRAPAKQEINGQMMPAVRELVRLNHHHNCITCHSPATSDPDFNKNGPTTDFVTAQATIPGSPSPAPSGYSGGAPRFPDIFVRVDVTYLRQDFSLLQKVKNGLTGAPMERFDFLVRTRAVKPKEAAAYDAWKDKQGPAFLSPNHQAALTALRLLTGRDAAPTAAAWREVLAEE
jgi:hypothetical protein